jgi:hypothetical protein
MRAVSAGLSLHARDETPLFIRQDERGHLGPDDETRAGIGSSVRVGKQCVDYSLPALGIRHILESGERTGRPDRRHSDRGLRIRGVQPDRSKTYGERQDDRERESPSPDRRHRF